VDPNKTINIAAGELRDSADKINCMLTSAVTKVLAAGWKSGSGQNGLDTGNPAVSTWYHVYAIGNDNGDLDFIFSTNATSPSFPGSYQYSRRIGSVLTDSSGNILVFTQNGDEFLFDTPILDVSALAVGTSAVLRVLSVPLGVVVNALFNLQAASGGAGVDLAVTSPLTADIDPLTIKNRSLALPATTTIVEVFNVRVNTSAQIRLRSDVAAQPTVSIGTFGWIDSRGKN
jgi:hypothetical protein